MQYDDVNIHVIDIQYIVLIQIEHLFQIIIVQKNIFHILLCDDEVELVIHNEVEVDDEK